MESLLKSALSGLVVRGALELQTASGKRWLFGNGSEPEIGVRFVDAAAQRAFLFDPELKLGELFMDQRLLVERGSIYDFLYLLLDNARDSAPSPLLAAIDRLRFATRRWRQRNDPRRALRNVAHHYDLGEPLYDLFLDSDRQYSCAYFETPEQSLEDAQLAKKRHIAAKLRVGPGDKVLDIGCGWGGLAMYLAEVAGADQVLGITLSKEQRATAEARAAERGLGRQVVFSLTDYRHQDGEFDRIVSVGMFEHVGLGYYDTYFRNCRRLLRDDGLMLLHTIGCSGPPSHANPWLDRYIFPGGYLPTLSEMMPAIERAGLIVTDIEVLRLHYASTLRAWRERFMARRAEAARLYDERFCRMWEFYLAFCEAAFRCEDVVVFQLQLATRNDSVPLTRHYIAEREQALKTEEQRRRASSSNVP
ncbi:MAG: SAM-dependent methyltransferase [Hydrocarboniphaga sp.]|uniref:SAM-dependent methyltransferase n=1 Tax=Hydrocarboniphaga sp. TaxID=2033016 RepID=UPI0026323BA9|nr:cyclopropane-fatty-acyl-phospholipid synthase family protein [Hydrocarboniphaga sp.]MDB5972581.1 SAM-dependent methyltransferase [Hydrocarboniphaga sp.]